MNSTQRDPSALFIDPPAPAYRWATGLHLRVLGLAALFISELLAISIWLDTSALDGKGGLLGAIGTAGPYILQALIVFSTVLVALGYSKLKDRLPAIDARLDETPLAWGWLAGHCASMIAFAFLSPLLFRPAAASANPGIPGELGWLGTGLCGIVAAIGFFFPRNTLQELAGGAGSAWLYASGTAVATPILVLGSKSLWTPTTNLTFVIVKFLLGPFVRTVVTIPGEKVIGTHRFAVSISPACSGLEGVGLMLTFSVLWLWFFRSDYNFPRALLLIPVGIGAIFLLNAVRIAALILIGDGGARAVALGGFHSQAGWIAFNGVALLFASVAHRIPWLASDRSARVIAAKDEPRAGTLPDAYLVPFLAILSAAMVSRATSGTFEWMYPLRFVAAGGALLFFRKRYAAIDWRFGWLAPVAGVAVFVLWIALDRINGVPSSTPAPAGLAAMPAAARITWLFFRVLGAVITVPIAEELVFRGFLLRRLISADFEAVSFRRWTFVAVVGSCVAFGLMHGDRWIAGSVAGLVYAGAQKWRGRIGDAMVAHAVTNALIAVMVLWGGQWSLW